MTTTAPTLWVYDDSVMFERDGRTIHGYVRLETTPGVYEVVGSEDCQEWNVAASELRPGPVTLIRKLVECDATPPHPRLWVEIEEHRDYYHPACPYCQLDSLTEAHSGCEHSRHGRWRRWRITHKAAGWLYLLGVTSTGGGAVFSAHCRGCLPRRSLRLRGRRVYLLGVPREHWACLRRGHWPGEQISWGLCGTCAPCVGCGSTKAECKPGCPETSAVTP